MGQVDGYEATKERLTFIVYVKGNFEFQDWKIKVNKYLKKFPVKRAMPPN
jgi:hypothetical protein